MNADRFHTILSSLASAIEHHTPTFLADPEDLAIAQGNLVFVAIDEVLAQALSEAEGIALLPVG